MLYPGNFGSLKVENINEQIANLRGDLSMEDAQLWLGKFLKYNLGFTYSFLVGGDNALFPFQHLKIRTMWERDYVLDICSRGYAKTHTAAIFCILYCIFVPGTKIVIASPSFKQNKNFMQRILDIANIPSAYFLRQVFNPSNREHCKLGNETWKFTIGDSTISCFALGDGKKMRGARANIVIIDEFLEMPKQVIEEVIVPFLIVNQGSIERQKIWELENELIKTGKIKDEDRIKFKNPKLIGLSTASFAQHHLHERFKQYIEAIINERYKNSEISYGVINFGWEFSPEKLLSREIIEREKNNVSISTFQREYLAQFPDDSAGYFKLNRLMAAREEKYPTLELEGDKNSEYLLSIDPNYKDQDDSDHFAMCLLKLNKDRTRWWVVHSFAMAGSGMADICNYLFYLLTNFNIIYICGDDAGLGTFINYCNDSGIFKGKGINLKPFDANFLSSDIEKGLLEARNSYNPADKRIIHYQNFGSGGFIPRANQELQAALEHKKCMFGAIPLDDLYDKVMKSQIDIEQIKFDKSNKYENKEHKMLEFIEQQCELIKLTIQECANIEVKASSDGHQSFELPKSMKNSTGPNKARKDSYTALLLANWGAKCYSDMMRNPIDETPQMFVPRWL
jgi:hypothetical protein